VAANLALTRAICKKFPKLRESFLKCNNFANLSGYVKN